MIKIPDKFHPILKRQIEKYLPNGNRSEEDIVSLLRAVHETYLSNDDGRKLLEHSLDVSSEELLQRNSEIRTIFEAFPDVFLRVDLAGKVLDFKTAKTGICQVFPEQMVGKQVQDFPFLKIDEVTIQQVHETRELVTYEQSIPTQDKVCYFEVRIKSLLKDQAIIILRDISERKAAEEKLRFAALHDQLTALPNRALLSDRLQHFMKRTRRNTNYQFAVMFLDFDRFKSVNDTLGHDAGDHLLVQISKRLLKAVRAVDTVARLGGDEFLIIQDDVKDEKDVIIVADRLQNSLSVPYVVGSKEIFLTVSIGIVVNSSADRSPDDFIRDADIAMYYAKNNGRAQYVFFTEGMRQQAIKIHDMEADLHRAIKNNEFELHYQPIISLDSKRVLRMEALIRWRHPTKGLIPPLDFIPLAEQTGLILKIGDYVLNKACSDCKRWQLDGFADMGVAINFSGLQFHHSNLPILIKNALEQAKLDPSFLEVEITESVAMKNLDFTLSILRRLKEMNVKVSIDDFGTGYSSLGSLTEFPIDSLKIDRKFIQHITSQKHSSSLTSAIIGLAHSLGLKVVGEGIETADQLRFLKNNNCDEGQGFLISKPMPQAQIFSLIKKLNLPQ